MKGRIEIRERKVYAVVSDTMHDRPELRKLYFRLGICSSELDEQALVELPGKEVGCDTQFGTAWIYLSSCRNWQCSGPHGNTQCDFVEMEPVPAPKCKVPTRWQYGRWQKCLKANGWVAA